MFVVDMLKELVDWSPVNVDEPVPVFKSYLDKGRILLGYEVKVKYMYHGTYRYFFGIDENKFGLVSRHKALKNAVVFYERKKQKTEQVKSKYNNMYTR